tara:strand:+ start:315 stop:710 length:396 start_codon:yes stop_codon:yes gene_type:complete
MDKIYIKWETVEELIDKLCYQIKLDYPEIKYVHGLKRGGLIPAVIISHLLDLEYVNSPKHYEPDECLIVDDICDSGVTLQKWIEYTTAVLHYKPYTACLTPSMNGVIHEGDEWIIYPWEKKDSETIQDYLK